MKKTVMVGVALMVVAPLRAETPPAQNTAAPAAAPATAPSGMVFDSSVAAWEKLQQDFKELQALGQDAAQKDPGKFKALLGEAHDFAMQYPHDPNAFNATMLWSQLANVMNQEKIPGGPTDAEVDQQLNKMATDDQVPKVKRAQIRAKQLVQALQTAIQAKGDSSAQWDAVEDKITGFQKEFGADFAFDGRQPLMIVLRTQELTILAAQPDKARYQALLQKLAKDPMPQIAAVAQQRIAQDNQLAEIKSKPLDLKFASVDGQAVDLSQMRGKVVLIDFWATWCGPCVGEVPHVVETYNKFHSKGFEIVGISLDQDKDKLLAFTKENGMVWPQYFDGQGWQNKISSGFGIQSIPAMWLIDKKGMLVTTEGREDLAGQVEKLLAAP